MVGSQQPPSSSPSSTPQTTLRQVQQIYDSRADTYDDGFHAPYTTKLLALLPDTVLRPGAQCLDLACGTGLVTMQLAARVAPNAHVLGLDVSEGMLRVARSKLARSGNEQGPTEQQGSLRDVVDFRSASIEGPELDSVLVGSGDEGLPLFDIIVCASALPLLQKPSDALAQWLRYLRPGTGRFLVDVPHPRSMLSATVLETVAVRLGLSMPYNRGWVGKESSLKEKLEGVGFTIERYEVISATGKETMKFAAGREIAEERLEGIVGGWTEGDAGIVKGQLGFWYRELGEHMRDKVREEFVKEWAACANQEGVIEEVDAQCVAVAVREE